MPTINIFVEDYSQEVFVTALVKRLGREYDLPVRVTARNARGGHGKAITEMKQYLRE